MEVKVMENTIALYDIYYNFFISLLGSATSFESTLIMCRYASIVLCFITFGFLMAICVGIFKWIQSWF